MTIESPITLPERETNEASRHAGLRLFAISFAALFLELMVIRWVPSVVRIVAYYSNLMLISSFLGLGLGAMLAGRRWNLLPWFPSIVAVDFLAIVLCKSLIGFPTNGSESRFDNGGQFLVNAISLAGVFILNAAVFVPLGQAIGRLFRLQSPLRAYSADLGGSLCGTISFGLFSIYHFSPLIAAAVVLAVFLFVSAGRQRLWNLPVLIAILLIVYTSNPPQSIWSPYYHVTVHPFSASAPPVSDPPPDLKTMINPPLFVVCVNNDFYQYHGSIDPKRYVADSELGHFVTYSLNTQYRLPYVLHPGSKKVCVVGAGGGMDVEAAILSHADSVDAVEIDPAVVALARRFAASDVYNNPKVTVHVNDARAFFQSSAGGYDLVVFGFLDSQSLFSYSSNIRLDGFIYTVQSIRKAYSLLKPDGMLSISFFVTRPWLADKLKGMIALATGREPVVYQSQGQYILCVPRNGIVSRAQPQLGLFQRDDSPAAAIELPTDDWPYLYLSKRTIPADYLIIIGALLALSAMAVLGLRWTDPQILGSRRISLTEGHFFFLGAGFLLLETKSIGDCSLYFGTTWFVTMVVVSGVLLMVLAANLFAMRLPQPRAGMYVPLVATLLALYLTPRDTILGLPFTWRLLWALFVVPLPVFFAGLIFSTSFRDAKDPAILLGANLVGATVGGFFEYAGMALGTRSLCLFVIAAYMASAGCWYRSRVAPT